ncbi:AraC family transcriptional regulator [Mycolicibacterium cosmeticum]|uniref:AraC family transcriptional regulator n=1 Tax=Mycolicibacterium cosmeticum TaxID=258533 RepID=UPI0032048337
MDALAGLPDGVRARGAFVLRLSLDPPWSMRIQDRALTLICQTAGGAVIATDGGDEFHLAAGDVALASGACEYVFASSPDVTPQLVIHPGQRCTTLRGDDMRFELSVGVRTWGNSVAGADRVVIGAYEGRSEVSARLLRALPAVLVIGQERPAPLIDLLTAEAGRDRVGQEAYLDRLLDLLLIDTLRTWFDGEGVAPPWWRAGDDAIVGPALRLIHHNPRQPWTVANLAATVGTSRAVLARRFTDLVGEPPIAFLTGWRLALAADLLRSGDHTVAAVADRVGYGTAFALSTAFKRAYGMSPAAYRARLAGDQVAGAAPA